MEFEFVKTLKTGDIAEGQGVRHKLPDGSEAAIFFTGGKYYAVDNRCPHMGMPLCEGILAENETLVCRYHQWKFDLKTGVSTFAPNIYVRRYETRIEDGHLWLKVMKFK